MYCQADARCTLEMEHKEGEMSQEFVNHTITDDFMKRVHAGD
jgi:hypothetical protein